MKIIKKNIINFWVVLIDMFMVEYMFMFEKKKNALSSIKINKYLSELILIHFIV